MSRSLKKPAKRTRGLNRPFDNAVIERATLLASRYRLLLDQPREGGFVGRALEIPECLGTGTTPDECVQDTREMLVSAIATMIELHESPPAPSGPQARHEQINIRVTPDEKLLLEDAARNRGFRGVSDFLRSAALSSLR
jgi:predicted RNase H-like HicB family nuclease